MGAVGAIDVLSLVCVLSHDPSPSLKYALDMLTTFCKASPGIAVTSESEGSEGVSVFVGRDAAEANAPSLCDGVDWKTLGDEGFVLRVGQVDDKPIIIAAGATDEGTRQAILALMRSLDVAKLPVTLPADLDISETPSFDLRGMYAHQHWAYGHPYSLRTWTVDEWKDYVDMLALMRVNLFQIWSMAGILPMPLSKEDEAFLRRYPPVIDHARGNHGMEVYIGECANNVCDKHDVPPITERLYFDVESLKDPANTDDMAQLRSARAEFYKICNNADGYWILDSDPGKWEGSPASEFVDILMMNRELIDAHTKLGNKAKLIYWMWMSWGDKEREQNWRETMDGILDRSPEPWWMTVAWKGHWQVADALKLDDRIIYYPYGAIEPEPSLPFTTVVPEALTEMLDVPERVGKIRGIMGNAQTPVCQLPNMYYFGRAAWDMNHRNAEREPSMHELARLIYPERAALLAKCWMSLSSPDAPEAAELGDELACHVEMETLGRPGPIGFKLFPAYDQIARDLVIQLRIHGLAMNFCKMADDTEVSESALLEQLKGYCLLSLKWRRQHGFRLYGTNGYNFFPLREAAHKHWWREDHLDKQVYAELAKAMTAEYEAYEAELILYPLNH